MEAITNPMDSILNSLGLDNIWAIFAYLAQLWPTASMNLSSNFGQLGSQFIQGVMAYGMEPVLNLLNLGILSAPTAG